MYYLVITLCCLWFSCDAMSHEIYNNKLRFQYGVNFKYNGVLHQNLARVWIVTRFHMPKIEDFDLPQKSFLPDCDFDLNKEGLSHTWTDKNDYLTGWLTTMCAAVSPQLQLLQKKERFYRAEVRRMIKDEIYEAIPDLESAGRVKRFSGLIPAIAGLVTLAVESLSGYLQHKRNQAMANAMSAFQKSNEGTLNQLNRYKSDLLLYGQFNVNCTEKIIETLNDMYTRQTFVEEIVSNLTADWPRRYLSREAGVSLYASHLAIYLSTVNEKFVKLHQELRYSLDKLLNDIKILSEGRLPINMIPPSMLNKFTNEVKKELVKSHPDYTLALPHTSYYYDMKLVTFGIDDTGDLIVTFPIFIKPVHSQPLILYEIETNHMPIDDLNPLLDSYSRVNINKPYIAANDHNYIQLRWQELHMCKVIQKDYFCEEMFMVKHANMHTCESTLFYDMPPHLVDKFCEFNFYLDKEVPPSVLDGGAQMILANLEKDTNLHCIKQIQNPLPGNAYLLTNRSLLCLCAIETGKAYIPPDIGACMDAKTLPKFEFTENLAFKTVYRELFSEARKLNASLPALPSEEMPSAAQPPPFPITLSESTVPKQITTLRQWAQYYNDTLHNASQHVDAVNISEAVTKYITEVTSLTVDQSKISALVIVCCLISLIIYIAWLSVKFRKLQTLVATMAINEKLPLSMAWNSFDATEKEPVVCHCQNVPITWILAIITMMGFLIYLYKWWKRMYLCKGFKFSKTLEVYCVFCNDYRYVPIKLISAPGHLHFLSLENNLTLDQVTLKREIFWDTLSFQWQDTILKYKGNKLSLPLTVVVPLQDKIRLRHIMTKDFSLFLLVKHGKEWKNLMTNNVSTSPEGNLV